MHDRPTAPELVAAARHFLETELLPTLGDARLRFQTLVAANVLAIAERELAAKDSHLRDELAWLMVELGSVPPAPEGTAALDGTVRHGNAELCRRIRAGRYDDAAAAARLRRVLRGFVEQKLEVANPRYLASVSGTTGKES